jgi:hypothetical protein
MPVKKRKNRERERDEGSRSSRLASLELRHRARDNRSTCAFETSLSTSNIRRIKVRGVPPRATRQMQPLSQSVRCVYVVCANLIKLENFERRRTAGRDADMGSEERRQPYLCVVSRCCQRGQGAWWFSACTVADKERDLDMSRRRDRLFFFSFTRGGGHYLPFPAVIRNGVCVREGEAIYIRRK